MRKARADADAGLRELTGEAGHARLLAGHPPKAAVPALANSLTQARLGPQAQQPVHRAREPGEHARALLIPLLLRRILRRHAAEHHRQYIGQQQRLA